MIQDPIRVLFFGAHPDDCEYHAGGTAALFASLGCPVKFVSLTNGDAGHHEMRGPELARRRLAESREAGRRLGVEYDVLDYHDGCLTASVEARCDVIREIREWNADLVAGHRPNDYHPDHRQAGLLLQDAAYLVCVPAIVPDVRPLRRNPVFLFYEDRFQRPNPFRADIAVAIDSVIDRKIDALDAHASQFYEWLPWIEGHAGDVPPSREARREWLKQTRAGAISAGTRARLAKWMGSEKARATLHAEAFEICEYGAQPGEARIRQLFPMLG